MPGEKNYDFVLVLIYLVDYSVVTYSYAPEIRLEEGFSDFGWVFAELFCAFDYSILNIFSCFLEFFCCFGMQ
jgi:hypothetical protein